MATPINRAAIDAVIRRNLGQFRNKGVFTVRPGYKFTGGWITDKPSIVATVDKKLENLPPSQMLPAEVENVPVDVREATGLQRLRHSDRAAHDLVVTHGRREFQEPNWQFERNAQTGKLVDHAPVTKQPALASAAKKPQVPYQPASVPLNPVTAPMTIIAHASPDAGWPVLQQFFNGIKSKLTVGMYDFTSKHVLDALESALKSGGKTLSLVLDHPPRNPSANQTDDQTKTALETELASRATIDWALTRNDPVVSGWIFPTAYHIKVAVRDSETFWLSSGNWNNSNQPDLAANDPSAGSLAKGDRDWHVVIDNAQLAKVFEAYLLQDLKSAAAHQGESKPQLHSALHAAMVAHQAASAKSTLNQILDAAPAVAPLLEAAAKKPPALVKPQTFPDVTIKVDPILTPDKGVYSGKILTLLKSAKKTLFMQTQYIHPSDQAQDADFDALIKAVKEKHEQGVVVRLITSEYENTPQWIEKMKEYDLDGVLRIQNRVHNKGIVIDSETVALGSQNWSGDGTLRNRDASVVIYHPPIAKYFEAIFNDDWTKRAQAKLVDASHPAGKGKKGGKSPPKKGGKTKPKGKGGTTSKKKKKRI